MNILAEQIEEVEVPEYAFLNNKISTDRIAIRILTGKYKDVVVSYSEIQFSPDEPNKIIFDFDVLTLPSKWKHPIKRIALKKRKGSIFKNFNILVCKIFHDITLQTTHKIDEENVSSQDECWVDDFDTEEEL